MSNFTIIVCAALLCVAGRVGRSQSSENTRESESTLLFEERCLNGRLYAIVLLQALYYQVSMVQVFDETGPASCDKIASIGDT